MEKCKLLNDVELKRQSEINPEKKEKSQMRLVYKYVSTDSAKKRLTLNKESKGSLIFAEPSTWNDPAEKAFYDATYVDEKGNEWNRPIVYACCITDLQQSEAAWATYQYQETNGCVKFSIDYDKLIKQISKYAGEKGCRFYVGRVVYDKWQKINSKELTDEVSSNVGITKKDDMEKNFLRYLLLKREAFAYEKEIRLFLVFDRDKAPKKQNENKSENETANSILVPIDWKECLQKVYVGEKCRYIDIREIKYLIKQIGFEKNEDDRVDATDLYEAKPKLNIKLIGKNTQSINKNHNENN